MGQSTIRRKVGIWRRRDWLPILPFISASSPIMRSRNYGLRYSFWKATSSSIGWNVRKKGGGFSKMSARDKALMTTYLVEVAYRKGNVSAWSEADGSYLWWYVLISASFWTLWQQRRFFQLCYWWSCSCKEVLHCTTFVCVERMQICYFRLPIAE